MGKSKEQKSSEALQLERLEQEVEANKWLSGFGKSMAEQTQKRLAEQQAYYKGDVDPLLKGYATTGFAPGERRRMRAQSEEDVARAYGQQERRTLGDMAKMGFTGRAPAGALGRAKLALGRGRAEARVAGLRGIEAGGAETRRQTVPLMMQRAQGFAPGQTMGGVTFGRPTAATPPPVFGKGFWGKAGGVITDVAKSAASAFTPMKF